MSTRDNLLTPIAFESDCCRQIYALDRHISKKAPLGEQEQPHAGGVEMNVNSNASLAVDH